jgi:hypothetical protein
MFFKVIALGVGPPISQPRRLPFLSRSLSEKATSVPLSLPERTSAIASMPQLESICRDLFGKGTAPWGGPSSSA